MGKTAIVTDSNSGITQAEAKAWNYSYSNAFSYSGNGFL